MLKEQTHIHFMGISGIGMSGIAKILVQQGYQVSGCDTGVDNKHIKELKSLGCQISQKHQTGICNDPSISSVVYTSAIPSSHPELTSAKNHNIPVLLRADMLAQIMQHKASIAVGGSHGKTSTSALLAHILINAQTKSSFVIGGHINSINTNASYGSGKYLVAEADESDRSLLKLPKQIAIVTNVDLEHLETYKDFEDVKQTFLTFLNTTPENGINIICLDDPGIQEILPDIQRAYLTYGTSNDADIQARNISLHANKSHFDIFQKSTQTILGSITLPEPGIHYVLNATAAIATALYINAPFSDIQKTLTSYSGVDRRFTYKGISKQHKAHIFDDYGHHPKEIKHALNVAHKKASQQLCVVFQPHRFSRTKHLWNDFVDTFSNNHIDSLIITDIFPASEAPINGVSSAKLVDEINQKAPHIKVQYCPIDQNLQTLKATLDQQLHQDDLLLLLGAGKIHKISEQLL